MDSRWTALEHGQDPFDEPVNIVVVNIGLMGIKAVNKVEMFLLVGNVTVQDAPLFFLRIPAGTEIKEYVHPAVFTEGPAAGFNCAHGGDGHSDVVSELELTSRCFSIAEDQAQLSQGIIEAILTCSRHQAFIHVPSILCKQYSFVAIIDFRLRAFCSYL